jgi:tetratricopeptide (TPR) repeat protein
MKPLTRPDKLRTVCLACAFWLSVSVAQAQGQGTPVDPHQGVEQLMRQDLLDQAMSKIKDHLAQRPRDPQMRFWQAVLLTRQGQRSQAMLVYTELTQDFPELAEPHNNLGVLQAANNDIDLAQRSFELALRADPKHALAHENLADVLLRQAQRHYTQAAQAQPQTTAKRANLALAQKQQLLQPLLKLTSPTP